MGTESGIPAKPPTPFAQTNRCFSKIFKANEKSSSFSTEYLNTLLVCGVLKAQYTPHTHTTGRPIQIISPHTPQAGPYRYTSPHTHRRQVGPYRCTPHTHPGPGAPTAATEGSELGGEAAAARPRSLPAAPYTSILSAPGAAAR